MKKTSSTDNQPDTFCGTTYAAKLLGLSVGSVQSLVESKKLIAWKTQGGHRRISMKSVLDLQKSNNFPEIKTPINAITHQILIIEDDDNTREMYKSYLEKWDLPFEIVIYASALDLLFDFHLMNPAILITDLNLPNMSGFDFIKIIKKKKEYDNLPIIAITGLSDQEINDRPDFDKDVVLIKKPVDMIWLKGFLQAILLKI